MLGLRDEVSGTSGRNRHPLAATFIDYMEPAAAEVPYVETLICEDAPSPDNPLGLKGAGEGGTVGCGAAIASVVEGALGMPGSITGGA